ncbi:MAG TPA: hypothetical protein VHO25_03115 [Polyangiaceae bacterium]|nr:hypothetical protein [Polyangiaceae bacterium]
MTWLRILTSTTDDAEWGPAGTRQVIDGGLRIELSADGRMTQSRELLPPGAKSLALPSWLGGGFVFWGHVERSTWLWRSDHFTSPLHPLAQVSTIVQRVVPGFDRLFLWSGATQVLRAIDARSGRALDVGALPASSAYGAMAFASPRFGVVASDVYGLQVTVDSGTSWHPLAIEDTDLQLQVTGGQIELRSNHDRYLLDARGVLTELAVQQGENESPDEDPVQDAAEDAAWSEVNQRGMSALVAALQHGFEVAADRAVVVHDGTLIRVRLSDAGIERRRDLPFLHSARCQALRIGRGHGFHCVDTAGSTRLYRYQESFSLQPLKTFSTARAVLASGTGSLVIQGSCANAASVAQDRYCLYDGRTWSEVQHDTHDRERVAFTARGGWLTLRPPDLKRPGSLLETERGQLRQRPLKLPTLSQPLRTLLAVGTWLNPLTEGTNGELSTWVIGDRQFVGVKVQRDGTVEVGPLRSDLSSTRFSGPIALTITAGAVAYQSSNFGFDWHNVGLPTSVAPPDPYTAGNQATSMDSWGCTPLGCVLGSWLRLGAAPGTLPAQAVEPSRTAFSKSGLPHWAMQCRATGERSKQITTTTNVEAESSRASSRPPGAAAFDAIQNGPWRPFLNEAPPLNNQQLGLDIGSDEYRTQFRVYSWGPRSTQWPSLARWQVRVANRFSVDSVWSTASARTPWSTPVIAALAFGQGDQSSEFVDWSVALDAKGEAGLLRLLSRAGGQLFWAEKDRPLRSFKHTAQLDLQKPMSLTRLLGKRYVGGEHDGSFVVFQLEADQLNELGRYPVLAPDSSKIQLITSRASDALAIWIKTSDRGWFVFPLDTDTGDVLPALRVSTEQLSSVPRTCTAEDEGWQIVSDVPLATLSGSPVNVRLSFPGEFDNVKTHDVEARVLVTQAGLCVEALAGQLEDGATAAQQSPSQMPGGEMPVAATLTDRATGRRFGFRCRR